VKTVPQIDGPTVKRWAKEGRTADIEQARLDGKLDVLLGGHARLAPDAVLTLDDVRELAQQGRHGEIEDARIDGRIRDLTDDTEEN